MSAKKPGFARLVLLQGLCALILLAFVTALKVEPALPSFGAETPWEIEEVRTPSLAGALIARPGAAKTLLCASFPMLRYVEEARSEAPTTGVLEKALGWFLGFPAKHVKDFTFFGLSGFLAQVEERVWNGDRPPETGWDAKPVLYLLPPGDDAVPVAALKSEPLIAIYHTHSSESFLPELGKSEAAQAFSNVQANTVVRVGEMLAQELQQRYRIPCLHSLTKHDEEGRLGAYYRSEATVKSILAQYPDCRILIDIHRDSQPRSITAVTIRGKSYARLMMVIGTDNPNWVQNYDFAKTLISCLEDGFPGLSRGVYYESAVYNQKHSPMAILVECGGVDNTLAECQNSIEALAWAVACAVMPVSPPRP